jgi:23S rRNA (cytosine1962-C5)-methyltransferase
MLKGVAKSSVEVPPGAVSPWVQLRSASTHPFVYRKMIRQADPAARPGDVVNVYDKAGQFFGRGFYNPRSQIVVRMLTLSDTPVDDAFWRGRLERALVLRRQLRLDEVTDAYRLVHSEGDGLSGLIAERYADYLVFEVFALGVFQRCGEFGRLLAELLGPATALDRPQKAGPDWRVLVRADGRIEHLEGFHATWPLPPDTPSQVVIREHGLRYRVDMKLGHKTGFFCDQRDNRLRLARLCRDATVLDLCCYTGGFSLCAAKIGGAREVTGVDLDEAAVAIAHENANLNQMRVDFVYADVFTYLRQMLANGRQFDVVILDPPKLATYRVECEDALRKYYDMNHLALQAVRPGGVLLTCSCSGLISRPVFQETVQRAATRAGCQLQLFERTGAAPDHPVMLNCPESAYLKALWFRVLK